jgi:hydrogenase-4 component B
MLTGLFRWGLRPDRHGGHVDGTFPGAAEFSSHTPDTVLDRFLLPLLRRLALASVWMRARIQHGITNFYILNVCLTVCFFLILVIFLRG